MTRLRNTGRSPLTELQKIDLAKMKRDFNNADGWFVSVRDQANVLSLIDAVEAAHEVARRPFGQLVERDFFRLRERLAWFSWGPSRPEGKRV